MSSSSGNAGKSKKKKPRAVPLRVLIRCSWSGARLPVPPSVTSDGAPVTSSSRLSDVVGSVRPSLPGAAFEGESAVVYLRRSAPRSEWGSTTLGDLGAGDDGGGGGGVLLTLNLPGGGGGGGAAAAAAASAPSAAAPEPPLPQPMDVDPPPPPSLGTRCESPAEALDMLLSSNFDADSREAVPTLLRVLDNVLTKPGDAKVRRIRLANAAFRRRVADRKGGLDFLLTVGFAAVPGPIPLLSGTIGGVAGAATGGEEEEAEFIELREENEDANKLLEARKLLASEAVRVLGMDASDLPKLSVPPPLVAAAAKRSSGPRPGGGEFDPYRTLSYNTQSAAAGAPDPHSVTPGSDGAYVSKTEKQLDELKARQARLERKMQRLEDRGLTATRPGPIVTLSTGEEDFGSSSGGGGKGDGALLAARMKRLEEERKKREEGGFTTKAMRDLEKMKKARVYSHASLRISFPDGCSLSAKFLPAERVRDVRSVVAEAFLLDLRSGLSFDLYVAPPRRPLEDGRRLDEEGLVPAAKVHVSWKVGRGPPAGWEAGAYLRPELFAAAAAAAAGGDEGGGGAFPDARKLIDDGSSKKKASAASSAAAAASSSGNGNGDPKAAREEELMRRMLGGSGGLLGKLGGGKKESGKKKDAEGGKKPRWFKG